VHAVALVPAEKVPAAQAKHVRSVVEVPALATDCPGAQSEKAWQRGAFSAVLKEPAGHAAKALSVVAVPAVITSCPAAQTDHGTHIVAALASWSQAPAAQGTGAARPPAHWVPAAQI
jgi:hypothetical protein